MIYGNTINTYADATIRLNNYDSQMPIYFQQYGNLVQNGQMGLDTVVYVEVLAAIPGDRWEPVLMAGTTTSVFELKEPGYFDAGVGVIPGASANSLVNLQVYCWFEKSGVKTGETPSEGWVERAGSWDPNSGLPATGPILDIPNSIIISPVPTPEPSTTILSVLGSLGMVLCAKRKSKM